MDTALKLQALRGCLAPAETRPKLAQLLRLMLPDGSRWVVASNGHIALAFASEPELEAAAEDATTVLVTLDNLVAVMEPVGDEALSVDTEELRAWALGLPGLVPEHFARGEIRPEPCGQCDPKRLVNCDNCDGTGEATEHHQGEAVEVDCWECDGDGQAPCPRCHPESDGSEGPYRRGWLGGVMLNRTLLYRVLRLVPAGTCRVRLREHFQAVLIQGDGWRAAVMPLRQTIDWDQAEREAPVFEPLRTAASAHGAGRAL